MSSFTLEKPWDELEELAPEVEEGEALVLVAELVKEEDEAEVVTEAESARGIITTTIMSRTMAASGSSSDGVDATCSSFSSHSRECLVLFQAPRAEPNCRKGSFRRRARVKSLHES